MPKGDAMLTRRETISAAAATAVLLGTAQAAAAASPKIIASEYWANKGDVRLYI